MSPDLSSPARSLWAKVSRENDNRWLPLYAHMSDAAETARRLWRDWVPRGVKNSIRENTKPAADMEAVERLIVFLAAAHDLGKATPAFQLAHFDPRHTLENVKARVSNAGLSCPHLAFPYEIRHEIASQFIAERHGILRSLAVILGGHHGTPPDNTKINDVQTGAYQRNMGFDDDKWRGVQSEFFRYALVLAEIDKAQIREYQPNVTAQMLLTGLVIMTDWLASDENRFSFIPNATFDVEASNPRAAQAWKDLALPPCWEPLDEDRLAQADLYDERFNIEKPHPVQTAVVEVMQIVKAPGIVVIEAPMGEGKTEAALAAAEILAAKTGRGGIFFALPTQATSDGMFPRVTEWMKKINTIPQTIILAHGKSRLNENYRGLQGANPNVGANEENENVIVHDWFNGRKKGLLADFVVGTVDQILMGGLKQKHLALRHLGLANKVVIIDECHAYDAYMNSYLTRALRWLGAYQTPVIILSATLPAETRRLLVDAYRGVNSAPDVPSDPVFDIVGEKSPPPAWAISRAYPLITYTDGGEVKQNDRIAPSARNATVEIARLRDEELVEKLNDLLRDGGCAGIIVNTVKRAQKIAKDLTAQFDNGAVKLLHSRFISSERIRKESELREMLGKDDSRRPSKLIVVGTQVIEQSLDLDFDVLFTDICPMDLLLQRMGRLHRHKRESRPAPVKNARCFVMGITEDGFDPGAEKIYGACMLMRTEHLLRDRVELPGDIPTFVQSAYDFEGLSLTSAEYGKAKDDYERRINEKKERAKSFQIREPNGSDLVGLLDTSVTDDASGQRASAAVRDAGDSIEVIVIQRRGDGKFYTLPFLAEFGGVEIPRSAPEEKLADLIAGCTVKLPPSFTFFRGRTFAVIDELEKNNREILPPDWQNSHWLKDELFLVLDENLTAEIAGYRLTYCKEYGLLDEKTETKSNG